MSIYLEIDDELKKNQKLWRYMDLAKFVSMLEKKAIWLARVDTFRDKHEGRMPDEMKKFIEKAYKNGFKDESATINNADDFQDYLVKNSFVSCWHKNLDENMVMWEIYGRDTNAVAIQTTVANLEESIDTSALKGESLILKSVIYEDANKIKGVLSYEQCVFRKRPHFSFENEVRISLDTYSTKVPAKNTPYGHLLPVSMIGLIDKVLVHPDSLEWFLDVVRSITDKYNIHDIEVCRGEYGTN